MRAAVQLTGAPPAAPAAAPPAAHALPRRLPRQCAHVTAYDGSARLAQDPQERGRAEQVLRVFGQSTDYVSHCKARNRRAPAAPTAPPPLVPAPRQRWTCGRRAAGRAG